MKRIQFALALVFLMFCSNFTAQAQGPGQESVAVQNYAPSGPCPSTATLVKVTSGAGGIYQCTNIVNGLGTWTKVAPSAGGGSGGTYCNATGGASNTLACTGSPVPASYTTGMVVSLNVDAANTGATTLNISSLGAKNVLLNGSALSSTSVTLGSTYLLSYDGTQFNLQPSGTQGPTGPTGPSGAQGPVVNRATSFTVDCSLDNLATERITAGGVAVTIPSCAANNVQFWVVNTQLGTPTFVASSSTINGGSTLNALPACVAIAGCTGYKLVQNPALASDWSAVTTTGTAGTNGTNGASGPSGPAGPTGATGATGPAGSGASTIDFQGTTGNLSESGAFVTVYSTTVASLAAGSCFEIQSNAVVSLANGGDFKIFVDAVQVAEPFNGASDLSFRLMHCNNHGVQNAQTSFYSLATLTYSGGTVSASTPAYGTPGTSAIDWSTSHVVTFQIKSASGTVTGKYWAVR